jgi:hypothetical protein
VNMLRSEVFMLSPLIMSEKRHEKIIISTALIFTKTLVLESFNIVWPIHQGHAFHNNYNYRNHLGKL